MQKYRKNHLEMIALGPHAEISLVAWSKKSFYALIVTLEVAWTLVVFRDRANIYTNSSETT